MADPHCPRCRSEDTQRVSRDSLFERLASIVYVYPFRCRACLRRFHALQWGQRYVRAQRERRTGKRWPVDIWTTLWLGAGAEPGRVRDLSATGLALETLAKLLPGQQLELDLHPGPGERPIRVEVSVVRTILPGRMGLRLLRVLDESDDRLRKFLAGRDPDDPGASAG